MARMGEKAEEVRALTEYSHLAEAAHQAVLGRKAELWSQALQTTLLPLSQGNGELEQRLGWCEQELAILKANIKIKLRATSK